MAGIGRFGDKKSYDPGDAVWVKGCPGDGVAHIVKMNDGSKQYDFRPKKGTYEIKYNSGMGVIEVHVEDLKPAKESEDAKDQARIAAERQRFQEARDRQAMLLEKLTKLEPMKIDENDPMAFMQLMGGMMNTGMTAMAQGDPDTADLEALRFQDAMAVNMGRSLGYCGAPHTDYKPGERVRVRQGINEEHWKVSVGDEGTVLEPDPIMGVFPVNPSQPKGIKIEWDSGKTSMMYVTNLEPAT